MAFPSAALRGLIAPTLLLAVLAGCKSSQDDGPSPTAPEGEPERALLTDVTAESGIDFQYENGETGTLYLPEIVGPGVALHDFDGDGRLDVYLVNGNGALPEARIESEPVNRLFLQKSAGRFVDATAESGLGDGGYGMGVAVGDVDNDGDPDVYVTNFGPDQLYLNRGEGRFERWTQQAGIAVDGWSTSAAFFDYDRDGLLDLYVARYVIADSAKQCFITSGARDYCGPLSFEPATDVLLHNEGGGRFRDVSQEAGIAGVAAAGLGVVVADFDDDGWTELAVANDGYENYLWMNSGDGTFAEDALIMGVAYNDAGKAEAGMGIISADLDEDGHLDLFMTHLRAETNTFYRSLGPGRGFVDGSAASGLGGPSMSLTGFGTAAVDLELDGDLDILVANGRVNRGSPTLPGAGPPPPLDILAEPNLLLLNEGGGRFVKAGKAGGAFNEPIEVSRGLATGDLDADGDLDVVVANLGSPTRIYRNDAPRRGRWLQVRALDSRWGRDAIGGRVTVGAGGRTFVRQLSAASSYLSSSEPIASFGLGEIDAFDWVDVRWADGERERFAGGAPDRRLVLTRGEGTAAP